MIYDIRDINKLESCTASLASSNQKIASDVASLIYIINTIKEKYNDDYETDMATIISELERCLDKLQNAITPTIGKYVETMNILVAETRTTQNKSM